MGLGRSNPHPLVLQLEKILGECCQKTFQQEFGDRLTLKQKQEVLSLAVTKFIRSNDMMAHFVDENQFQFRLVNISDPLLPSNNIGKTVNKQNLLRMQRCMQSGYLQCLNMLTQASEGEITVVNCLTEFDLLFVNTLTLIKSQKGDVDLEVDDNVLYKAILKVVSWSFGLKSKGVVWDD